MHLSFLFFIGVVVQARVRKELNEAGLAATPGQAAPRHLDYTGVLSCLLPSVSCFTSAPLCPFLFTLCLLMFPPLLLLPAFKTVASACSLSVGLHYLKVNQASVL